MAAKNIYVCSECGHNSAKWLGKCPACGEWDTFSEETVVKTPQNKRTSYAVSAEPEKIGAIELSDEMRYKTGIGELDRVFGGGVVKGSVVLISGDPGIGKSTILLQICEYLGKNLKILYVSGEESASQIKLRSKRLSVNAENLFVMSETSIDAVLSAIEKTAPQIVIIDSIQTMQSSEVSSIPGSITQVKECARAIIEMSKSGDITTFMVGHVNKEGTIAGPKVLEHMVDTVLYFEGDKSLNYRLLRATKNRYGSTNEIGMFEMQSTGLIEVENPSETLLSGKPQGVPGSCAICVIEGTRPILAEVQALAAKTIYPVAKRTVTGIEFNRLSMLIAVLEKRLMMNFAGFDVFVNVIGGLRISEPSCDAATAIALASSYRDIPVDDKLIAIGEVGLAGELRSVRGIELQIAEAVRLGFDKIIIPYHNKISINPKGAKVFPVKNIGQALSIALDKKLN